MHPKEGAWPPDRSFNPASSIAGRRSGGSCAYGEALHLRLSQGDLLNIVNDEGAATAWLVPFDGRGMQERASLGMQGRQLSNLPTSGWDRRIFDAQSGAAGTEDLLLEHCLTVWNHEEFQI